MSIYTSLIHLVSSPFVNALIFILARGFNFVKLYGISGLVLLFFGSRTTWHLEAQVLGRFHDGKLIDKHALAFKKTVSDECTMISVAAALIASISVAALALASRGCIVFSLTSSLMAVFYATAQQRTMGRLLEPHDIRKWIRGGTKNPPPLKPVVVDSVKTFTPSDLEDLIKRGAPKGADRDAVREALIRHCFTTSVTAVVTMAAPQGLLSASVFALLIALGIYLGFTWTRNLDRYAGLHDSRNVFICYIVSLAVCLIVYSISALIQDRDTRSEYAIAKHNCDVWLISEMHKGGDPLSLAVRQEDVLEQPGNPEDQV